MFYIPSYFVGLVMYYNKILLLLLLFTLLCFKNPIGEEITFCRTFEMKSEFFLSLFFLIKIKCKSRNTFKFDYISVLFIIQF